ncbi:MAG: hypothetical protein ACLFPB_07920, partial [Desulfovermiculus sp.]
ACCDHTCNNPMLNQMVVNLISLPGVMSPEMVEEFKIAVQKATGEILEEQVQQRKDLQKKLSQSLKQDESNKDKQKSRKQSRDSDKEASAKGKESKKVQGYKMEKMDKQDKTSKLSSSGVQWFASFFILCILGLFVLGAIR